MLATTVPTLTGCVTDRIRQVAALRPRDQALAAGDRTVCFRELDLQSSRLALWLRAEAGICSDSTVALLMNRSIDFVVAALAVMKAGAAYVPIDPASPDARRRTILRDAGASLLIAHRCIAGSAEDIQQPWPCRVWIYSEDEVAAASGQAPEDISLESPEADRLAYIIYTSGSTGEPKGVEITHGNLTNLLDWHRQAFDVTCEDRASHLAGLGFDAAVWEIWANLCAGASLHIAPESVRTSAPSLRDWLLRNGITIAFAPTVIAQQLIALEWPDTGIRLRALLTGADRLLQRPPAHLPFLFFNNYGPTECTVVATSGLVQPTGSASPSIGLAANAAELQIDEHGELWIAGPLVGRGYRNQPELTAVRFRENNGVRAYRTGDRVRKLPNGEIEFLGRLDDQLKIRGYRVEPGEIAAALMRHPSLSAAAVIGREDVVPGEKVLVAYFVVAPGRPPVDPDALRVHLSALLAAYMIPNEFVALPAMPLTVNGKVDTAALARMPLQTGTPEHGKSIDEHPDAIRDIREQVGRIVSKLLNKPDVDPDANIFLLGGHSLLAAQLLVQINRTFGVKLALRQMFQFATVNALAAELSGRKAPVK
jgi:amino acid adenylation domain-containing protein